MRSRLLRAHPFAGNQMRYVSIASPTATVLFVGAYSEIEKLRAELAAKKVSTP